MNKLFIISILFFNSIILLAQSTSLTIQDLSALTGDQFGAGRMVRINNDQMAINVEGNYYYTDSVFRLGEFALKKNDKEIGPVLIRFNIYSNELELKTDNAIRAFYSNEISAFSMEDSKAHVKNFISIDDFKLNGVPLIGFVEVLCSGKFLLLKEKKVSFVKGEYHPQMGPRSETVKLLRNSKYYVLEKGSIHPIVNNKTELETLFTNLAEQANAYRKKGKLNLKNEEDLIDLVKYVNLIGKDSPQPPK